MTRARRAGLAAVTGVSLAGLALGGCTVGSGSGSAVGPLWVLGCSPDRPEGNLGTPENPQDPFSLDPTFFAAEPIESTTPTLHENRLLIRMQHTGQAVEINDTLTFDIQNSFEVARCVRGRTINGVPDFDVPTPESGREPWCDWSGGGFQPLDGGVVTGDGGASPTPGVARLRVTSQGYVQASLVLLETCPLREGAALVGHAVDGWIEFFAFGSAANPDPNEPAEERHRIEDDFKVNYDERLHANFHIILEDDRVITAERLHRPMPSPRIGGTLDGRFDFDMVRGRAAQPFP